MNAFWSARSPRERSILTIGAAVVVALLLIAFVWLPLDRSRKALAAEIPRIESTLTRMAAQADEAKRVRTLPASTPATLAPMTSIAPTLAKGVPSAAVMAMDDRRLRITGADVPYGALLEAIASAQATYGLRVDSASIDALPAAGRVRAELVLARP